MVRFRRVKVVREVSKRVRRIGLRKLRRVIAMDSTEDGGPSSAGDEVGSSRNQTIEGP